MDTTKLTTAEEARKLGHSPFFGWCLPYEHYMIDNAVADLQRASRDYSFVSDGKRTMIWAKD